MSHAQSGKSGDLVSLKLYANAPLSIDNSGSIQSDASSIRPQTPPGRKFSWRTINIPVNILPRDRTMTKEQQERRSKVGRSTRKVASEIRTTNPDMTHMPPVDRNVKMQEVAEDYEPSSVP
jgi:hypothetical protein